jgi:hypothetical protein
VHRIVAQGLGLALLIALATGCGARTDLTEVWRARIAAGPVQRVLVIGVSEKESSRRLFEDHFSEELRKRGVHAVPSYERLPGGERMTEPAIRGVIAQESLDAVVVTRLVKVEQEQRYVPPQTHIIPGGYYGGWYGYYGVGYDVVSSPGYWRTVTIVKLETHLYDAGSKDLLWAAQSDTFNPSSGEDTIRSATKAVTRRMASDGVLP